MPKPLPFVILALLPLPTLSSCHAAAVDHLPGCILRTIADEYVVVPENRTDISIGEFATLASRLTGREFGVYEEDRGERVRFDELRLRRREAFGVLQALLFVRGFACVIRGEAAAGPVTVISMRGAGRPEPMQRQQPIVSPKGLAAFADDAQSTIVSVVSLRHRQVADLLEELALTPPEFSHVVSPTTLVLSGQARAVAQTARALLAADRPND